MRWSDRVGRRLKLNDLHVLIAVIQSGSMGKAAAQLHTSQSAISRSVADLEHALGVALLDRGPRGVEPTKYGRALLDCGMAVFDDLRQGVKNIDFLADPATGEIRIGGNEAIIAGLLPTVFSQLRLRHPGIAIHVDQLATIEQQYAHLRARNVDLVLARTARRIDADVAAETLFHERTFVVAGRKNPWTRRRKIDFAELANEPWALPPHDTMVETIFSEAFRAHGLAYPSRGVAFGAIHLHIALVANGPFLAMWPGSVLRFGVNRQLFKVLPVDLPVPPWPVGVMTLKNRTVSPVVQLFIACAREVAKALARDT
jgi:DNA-binding transcriptional LysR family regulator